MIDITQKWADSSLTQQSNEDDEEDDNEELEDEKLQMQTRSRDNLVLKFDKHAEKIKEIFEKYWERREEDLKEEKSELTSANYSVKLKNIPNILDDIAYLTGISIMSFNEHLEGVSQK